MAYMSQEKKAKIAPTVKKILAKYGVKGSLAVSNHMTLVLNVKSGAIDFISNFNDTVSAQPGGFRTGSAAKDHIDVNPYWYHEHFSGKSKEFISEAMDALKSADWYDESDAQVDYFNTAYYVDINIGKWNKPYIVE